MPYWNHDFYYYPPLPYYPPSYYPGRQGTGYGLFLVTLVLLLLLGAGYYYYNWLT